MSKEAQILAHLKKCGRYGAYNYELSKICLSWHRRITDLRKSGEHIVMVRLSGGTTKYYLIQEDPLET